MSDTLSNQEINALLNGIINAKPEIVETQQNILFSQNLDQLTGLRKAADCEGGFDKMLEASETDVSIVLADLDMFKRINDNYGHDVGDKIIKEIADNLKAIDAKKDVYRYGGEEYLIIFPGMPKEEAFLIMETARKTITGETVREYSMTVSMGIATYPDDGTNWVELKRKAEGALYRAKTAGRNKICLAKEEKLVTKTAHYTVEQLKRLEKLATEKKTSEAALMREALDDLLKKYNI